MRGGRAGRPFSAAHVGALGGPSTHGREEIEAPGSIPVFAPGGRMSFLPGTTEAVRARLARRALSPGGCDRPTNTADHLAVRAVDFVEHLGQGPGQVSVVVPRYQVVPRLRRW